MRPVELAPGKEDDVLRLFAVLRTDIVMPPGKAAAQAGHAFVGALVAASRSNLAHDARRYLAEHPGTKVTLGAALADIERLAGRLEAAGIPSFLVIDSGHALPPDFDGRPIVTALGVGPLNRAMSLKHLGRFRLYGG